MSTKSAVKGAFVMAAVWFAVHSGGGFATGNQEANYYVKFGWYSLFLPMIAMIVVGWGHRNALIIAKDHKTYDYKSFCNVLFHPYEKFFSPLFEISFIFLAFFAISASIAAAGSLIENILGISYGFSIVLIGIILVLLTILGSHFVAKALSYQSYFLIGTLLIIGLVGVYAGLPNLQKLVIERETFGYSFFDALWNAMLYVGFQSFAILPIISVAHRVQSDKECNLFMVFGALLNGLFLILICAMLFAFAPESLVEQLPVYYVTKMHLNIPFLQAFYNFIIFIALISTVLSMLYAIVARFEKLLREHEVVKNEKTSRVFVTVIVLILCTIISTVGLTNIVVKGYGALGYIGILLVLLPEIIVGTIKIKKRRRQEI